MYWSPLGVSIMREKIELADYELVLSCGLKWVLNE